MPLVFVPLPRKRKFYDYFEQSHSPASTKHFHKESEMERVHADRSINPLPKDVYYLFKKWREETLGKESGEGMFIKLEGMVAKYNEDNAKDGGRAVIQRYESKKITTWETRDSAEQPLVLAVCTPNG